MQQQKPKKRTNAKKKVKETEDLNESEENINDYFRDSDEENYKYDAVEEEPIKKVSCLIVEALEEETRNGPGPPQKEEAEKAQRDQPEPGRRYAANFRGLPL